MAAWKRGEEEEEAVSTNREPHCLSRKAFPAVGCHRKHSLRSVASLRIANVSVPPSLLPPRFSKDSFLTKKKKKKGKRNGNVWKEGLCKVYRFSERITLGGKDDDPRLPLADSLPPKEGAALLPADRLLSQASIERGGREEVHTSVPTV